MVNTDPDDDFARHLSRLDAILASGSHDSHLELPIGLSDPATRQRLDHAKECLQLLESVWPRSQDDITQPPESVGRFRIVQELGVGGFGVVYLARDEKLARFVALKLQRPEAVVSPSLRKRFVAEARAAGRLRHANIATVYEVGEAGVHIWLATEYCDGGSLADWLCAGHPTTSMQCAATFVATLAFALEYSHQRGVLHRDIKPSNILLQRATASACDNAESLTGYVPKIIDFGLAKNDEEPSQVTRSGALIGTPAYMSPEQANGRIDQVGPRTDVYGLGLILYELLTGRPAFFGESDLSVLTKVGAGDFVHPRVVRRELSRDLEAICLKCLQTSPRDRYASAADVANDLQRFLRGTPTYARPLSAVQKATHWLRRRPAAAALLSVSVVGSLALAGMTGLYITGLKEARDEKDRARLVAEESARHADQQEAIAQEHLFSSRIALAFQDLERGNPEDAEARLAPYADDPILSRLQDFTWYHLQQRLHGDAVTLAGHGGEVYSVVFSPDDQFAVSGGQDGIVRYWEKASGKLVHQLPAHSNCVNSLSFSADGNLLASGGCDGVVNVWDSATRQLRTTLRDHPPVVECVAFSPVANNRLASCGNDSVVRVWDVESGLRAKSFDTHASSVKAILWSRDGRTLYVIACRPHSTHNTIFAWRPETDSVESIVIDAQSMGISNKTNEIFVGLVDSTIRLLKAGSLDPDILVGHQSQVNALAFSPDGDCLASASDDSRIRLWDVTKRNHLRTLSEHTGRVQSITFDQQGQTLASASYDHTVKLWNLSGGSQQMLAISLSEHGAIAPRQRVAFSGDLRRVVSLTSMNRLELLDIASRKVIANVVVPEVSDIQYLGDGDRVAARSLSGPPRRYTWRDNLSIRQEEALPFQGNFAYDADGNWAFGQSGEQAGFCERVSGELVLKTDWPAPDLLHQYEVCLSPDRQLFGVFSAKEQASWIVRPTSPTSSKALSGSLRAITNDGSLALIDHNTRLSSYALIDTRTGKQRAILTHQAKVNDVVFAPDSKTLATGCSNGVVCLWHVATGQELAQLPASSGEVVHVKFASDSRALAALVDDSTGDENSPGTKNLRVFIWSGDRGRGGTNVVCE